MISDDELQALTDYIITLEAQDAFLLRERDMYSRGPAAAQALAKAALDPCPPGYSRGAAGQLVLTEHALIYDMMHTLWPSPPPRKRARRPEEDV